MLEFAHITDTFAAQTTLSTTPDTLLIKLAKQARGRGFCANAMQKDANYICIYIPSRTQDRSTIIAITGELSLAAALEDTTVHNLSNVSPSADCMTITIIPVSGEF